MVGPVGAAQPGARLAQHPRLAPTESQQGLPRVARAHRRHEQRVHRDADRSPDDRLHHAVERVVARLPDGEHQQRGDRHLHRAGVTELLDLPDSAAEQHHHQHRPPVQADDLGDRRGEQDADDDPGRPLQPLGHRLEHGPLDDQQSGQRGEHRVAGTGRATRLVGERRGQRGLRRLQAEVGAEGGHRPGAHRTSLAAILRSGDAVTFGLTIMVELLGRPDEPSVRSAGRLRRSRGARRPVRCVRRPGRAPGEPGSDPLSGRRHADVHGSGRRGCPRQPPDPGGDRPQPRRPGGRGHRWWRAAGGGRRAAGRRGLPGEPRRHPESARLLPDERRLPVLDRRDGRQRRRHPGRGRRRVPGRPGDGHDGQGRRHLRGADLAGHRAVPGGG